MISSTLKGSAGFAETSVKGTNNPAIFPPRGSASKIARLLCCSRPSAKDALPPETILLVAKGVSLSSNFEKLTLFATQ
jgi:hypothetical protein